MPQDARIDLPLEQVEAIGAGRSFAVPALPRAPQTPPRPIVSPPIACAVHFVLLGFQACAAKAEETP